MGWSRASTHCGPMHPAPNPSRLRLGPSIFTTPPTDSPRPPLPTPCESVLAALLPPPARSRPTPTALPTPSHPIPTPSDPTPPSRTALQGQHAAGRRAQRLSRRLPGQRLQRGALRAAAAGAAAMLPVLAPEPPAAPAANQQQQQQAAAKAAAAAVQQQQAGEKRIAGAAACGMAQLQALDCAALVAPSPSCATAGRTQRALKPWQCARPWVRAYCSTLLLVVDGATAAAPAFCPAAAAAAAEAKVGSPSTKQNAAFSRLLAGGPAAQQQQPEVAAAATTAGVFTRMHSVLCVRVLVCVWGGRRGHAACRLAL